MDLQSIPLVPADARCRTPCADSWLTATASEPGAAAREAGNQKRQKYTDVERRFGFQPLVFESTGACGLSTRTFISELGARITVRRADEAEDQLQRLSLTVIQGNAASILSAPGHSEGFIDNNATFTA